MSTLLLIAGGLFVLSSSSKPAAPKPPPPPSSNTDIARSVFAFLDDGAKAAQEIAADWRKSGSSTSTT